MILAHYCLYFIIYSFLGWIYESLFYSVQLKRPVNTGFLHGCLCPIYGIACVFNVAALYPVDNNAEVFLISMISISAIEYLVSYILETIFEKRWWDYSGWPCNLNGRISLISSLGFGIMSVLQLRLLHPFVAMLVEALSYDLAMALLTLVAIGVSADLLMTLRRIDKEEGRLRFIEEETELVQRANERLESGTKRINDVREYIKDRFIK